ncbi:hypothetical protein [Actinocatenispora thailandica]|uniref:hypothetical protein n=1 Tax=Actinocatenispora thailandica TaxID=227318 RepID=UPI00194DC3C0|nr:hypothetical protein [Actinocatenispora thailandica]
MAGTDLVSDAVRRGRQVRRRRNVVLAGTAGVVAVALGGTGLVVRSQLPGTTARVAAASDGGGRYDPLVSRLAPGWMPSGATVRQRGTTRDRLQSLTYLRSVPDPKEPKAVRFVWIVELTLFAPGVRPVPARTAEDGPLEGLTFGSGKKVAPVQGMPAELLPDPNGYTLEWAYPSGAHAVVTIPVTGGSRGTGAVGPGATAGTGFGDRTPAVARRIAENLRIDGNTALRFPFALRLPAGQHVVGAGTTYADSGSLGGTSATLRVGTSDQPKTWSSISLSSDIAPGKHVTVRHGFMVQVTPARGVAAATLTHGLRIFGEPRDPSTWRADPIRG